MIIRLTQAQRSVLEPAASRPDDCIFPVTVNLKGGAVGNVCKSLLKRGLIEEVPATDDQTVWRHGEEGPLTLRATKAGRQALHCESVVTRSQATPQGSARPTAAPQPKTSCQNTLVTLLGRPQGATIADMSQATGWQAHSVRGALSGIIGKKLGLTLLSEKLPERGRVYRIK